MKHKRYKPLILFNASVVIAALYNPLGGSGKLLNWVKDKKVVGIISEVILDEVNKHVSNSRIENILIIASHPAEKTVKKYDSIVVDLGDSHVLASAEELSVDYLVTHDKKHLLSLKNKIKKIQIISVKELIEKLQKLWLSFY